MSLLTKYNDKILKENLKDLKIARQKKLDVNLISLGPSILTGLLSRDYTMYLEIDLIIKLNEKSIPIKLLKKIIVNTKSFEITIE